MSAADQERIAAIIIHGFAVAHAVAAATLSQTLAGDEVVLTALTISMVITLSRQYKSGWGAEDALSISACFAGWYLGSRGLVFLVKWIPGLGNGANAIVTFATTETIGWTIVFLLKNRINPNEVNSKNIGEYKKQGENLKEKNKEVTEEIKKIIKSMTEEDKKRYDTIMDELKSGKTSDLVRDLLTKELDKLFEKYRQSRRNDTEDEENLDIGCDDCYHDPYNYL